MSASQGAWECRHDVDGRDWCEECHSENPPRVTAAEGTARFQAVEYARRAHSGAMEALGADVHPYSGQAIRDHEAALDAALSLLEQLAEAAENMVTPGDGWKATEADDTLRRALAAVRAGSSQSDDHGELRSAGRGA